MKRLLLTLLLLAPLPCQAALTDFWPCNDVEADTVVDATTGTDGVFNGGDNVNTHSVTGPSGAAALALDLLGVDDSIGVGPSAISYAAGTACSFFIVVNFDATTGVLWGNTGSDTPRISKSADTTIAIAWSGGSASWTVPSLGTTNWHSVLVTRTTGNSTRVFIDGTESVSGGQAVAQTLNFNQVGRRSAVFLDGAVCWIKVFNSDESANAAALHAEAFASAGFAVNPMSFGPPQSTPGALDPLGH